MSTIPIKDLQNLERKIVAAINQIKSGNSTPLKSQIGSLLVCLKSYDEASYENHLKLYKPVFDEWKAKQEKLEKKGNREAKKVSEDEFLEED